MTVYEGMRATLIGEAAPLVISVAFIPMAFAFSVARPLDPSSKAN
jgi:hypothetical protein